MSLQDWGGYGGIAATLTLLIVIAQLIHGWRNRPTVKWEPRYAGGYGHHRLFIVNKGQTNAINVIVKPHNGKLKRGNPQNWSAFIPPGEAIDLELDEAFKDTWFEISWDKNNSKRQATWVPLSHRGGLAEVLQEQQSWWWGKKLYAWIKYKRKVGPEARLVSIQTTPSK